jgi:enamine deaminase RidA (YjgF/YER057c/UK114 family)
MSKQIFFVGSKFEEEYGFSKAIRHGGVIYVSGSSGYNYEKEDISPDATAQLRQAFANVETALNHFGSDLSDLLQVQIYYSAAEVWEEIGSTLKEMLGPSSSTLFAVEARLPLPEFKIELVATAAARE